MSPRDEIRKRIKAEVKVFFGYDEKEEIARHRKENIPFLYVDHAYIGRGYDKGNFRALYQTIHRTNLLDVTDDRSKKFGVTLRPWRTGERIVFIPSPKNPIWYHRDNEWNDRTLKQLVKLTKREIYVKSDKTNGLGDSIKNCYALVSHCSVAGVEAAIHGVRVVSGTESPANQVGVRVEQINDVIEPDRTQWVNTLCYSQFTLDELSSGTAWKIIKETENL